MGNLVQWVKGQLENTQVLILIFVVFFMVMVAYFFGHILAPVFLAVVIAYLLDSLIKRLSLLGVSRSISVLVVFFSFVFACIMALFLVLPALWNQSTQLLQQAPNFIAETRVLVLSLPDRFPEFITTHQIEDFFSQVQKQFSQLGQTLFSYSVSGAVSLLTIAIYLVIVPFLSFFFLKDKDVILRWVRGFFPSDIGWVRNLWIDIDVQIGNYIRGKVLEMLIIWLVSFIAFFFAGLDYAFLLASLVGISVFIPYVGAFLVTIPITLVALFQWGWGDNFFILMLIYLAIQLLDANLLVPVLFSEVVDLSPVSIILAVLFFGGLWGFLGVFFAIPLAAALQAVISAWPNVKDESNLPEKSQT